MVRYWQLGPNHRCLVERSEDSRKASQNGLLRTGVDVTSQNQLTQELQRREAYLAEAQRLSHTGSFGWNVSTNEHFWSEETFRIFEFAPSSKVSLGMILDCVHPQDMPPVNMAIAAANRAEGIDLEFRLLMPDGRTKYLHVVGKAERGETGGIEVIGAVMDVTARKLIEVELRRSKEHLADAQRLSRTGSVGMEVSTRRIFWSNEAARIYGYPPGTEPTPDLILQRAHPDDVDLRSEVIGAVMDVTARKLIEVELRRSKEHLADAQRLSRTGSVGMEVSTRRIFWSNEAARIYGYPPGTEPTPDLILQRAHPDDVDL